MSDSNLSKWDQDTGNVIKDTLTCLAEGLTGIAAADRKELAFSVGHIFQSLRKGQFLSKLLEEWNKFRQKGQIKDDYVTSEQHYVCLQEFLQFLDKDCPDETRFEVLKKVFIVAATEKVSDRNSLLPYQFLRLCREMSSGEIIVMNTTYEISKSKPLPDITGANNWLKIIADKSGFNHSSLVEIYEEELMEKRILSKRRHTDGSGVTINPHFRLTDLGFELCEYISNYEKSS
jgi:hypothetical protein